MKTLPVPDPRNPGQKITLRQLGRTYDLKKPGELDQLKADMLARVEARKKAEKAKEASQ